jgi:hypothetical protein
MGNIGPVRQRYDVLPVSDFAVADRIVAGAPSTVPSPEPLPTPYPQPTPEPIPTPDSRV